MKIKKESILYGVLILIIGITIISMIFIFDYGDLDALTAWSVNLLDAIADGNLMNYYSYTVHSIRGHQKRYFQEVSLMKSHLLFGIFRCGLLILGM